jgi:hypothetical protein
MKRFSHMIISAALAIIVFPMLAVAAQSAQSDTVKTSVVHVTLRDTAIVDADENGFFNLGSVADITGGTTALRLKMAAVIVGRAPLSNSIRLLTPGDIALKLRQAKFDPDKEISLEGAVKTLVSVTGSVVVPITSKLGAPPAKTDKTASLIHRGQQVTIVVHDDNMTITATGVAREDGGAGDSIHVHRDGTLNDLSVVVIDAQTVQLEI